MDAVTDDEDAVIEAIRTAEELPRVRNTADVELHGVGVNRDGDRPVCDQPFRHVVFVLADVHRSCELGSEQGLVVVAFFVFRVVRVIAF